MVNAFWLIPAPPLFGALAMLLVGRKCAHRVVSVLCCGTVQEIQSNPKVQEVYLHRA